MSLRICFVLSLLLSSLLAQAQPEKTLYEVRCSACHQADGSGSSALKAPNLSGLSTAYVARQLQLFKSNQRGHHAQDTFGQMMKAAVVGISSEDLNVIAGYVGSLEDVDVNSEKQSTGFRGRGLYSVCSSCHGSQGEGNSELGAPRIAQQHSWYLESQLKNYKQGWRGGEGSDELSQQMRAMASTIDEADFEILIRHISGMGIKP